MTTFSTLFLLIASASLVLGQDCPLRCVRKEVRTLTPELRSKYFTAMRSIMQSGRYDEFTENHVTYTRNAHGNSAFFPWHRAMMREMEKSLQAVDKDVCMHYWSWDVDSQRPDASPIFTSGYYQADGNGGCVNSQWLGGWQPAHPSRHCLRRAFDASDSMSAFTGPEVLNSVISRTTSYDSFRSRIEGSPHANVHVNVGGDMAVMSSPNDPIFYAHHTFIDKLWWTWQTVRGDMTLYGGPHWSGRGSASASDALEPYPYTVADVFNIASLCYSYEDFNGSAQRAAALSLPVAKIQGVTDNSPISLANISSILPDVTFVPLGEGTASIATTTPAAAPSADDKFNLVYLRSPKPIPAEWIQMNNLTETEIRQYEQEHSTIITQLNSISGYVSPCALLHRADLLVSDIKAKRSQQYVCPITGKGRLEFKVQGEGAQEASNIISTVKRSAPEVSGDLTQLRAQLVALVGEPVMSKQSASNFLTSLDEKEKITPVDGKPSMATTLSPVWGVLASLVVVVVAA